MVVFSNQRIGPAAELQVSPEVASAMLRATAEAARPLALGRWEVELVLWLDDRSQAGSVAGFDVGDIAWSPEHFESQRRFLSDAIHRATEGSAHARALGMWARMVDAYPHDSVVVGRRWQWVGEATRY